MFKHRILLVALVLVLGISDSSLRAQSEKPSLDSIHSRFLRHGAWRVSIHTPEYGRFIDSAIAFYPQDDYLWQQRGMPYWKEQKYEIAERYTDSAVKYNPRQWLDYRAFCKCIFAKKYTSSLADFRLAESQWGNPTVMDHEYHFYMGLCFLQLAQFDSAESYFRAVIANDTKVGESWVHPLHSFYLGIALYEEQHYEAAIEWFDRSIARYPNFADPKIYRGMCLERLNRAPEALPMALAAQADFNDGGTINEDNALYERYPYQVTARLIKACCEGWKEKPDAQ